VHFSARLLEFDIARFGCAAHEFSFSSAAWGSRRLDRIRRRGRLPQLKRNTQTVLDAGRNGEFENLPKNVIDTGQTFDCVIVGGGISGLAAALFFLRQAGNKRKVLVLDNHPIFGGEAKQNEFMVDGHRLVAHQGSAVFFVNIRTVLFRGSTNPSA